MANDGYLLHTDAMERLPLRGGRKIIGFLRSRAEQIKADTKGLSDSDISVVIRTRNNIDHIDDLLSDIKAQVFAGKVEIILVDTESTDGTVEVAKRHGARVINIKQRDFNYPRALNIGYEAAKYPYVASFSGHCNLGSRYLLKSLTYWAQQPNFGGIYCTPLVNQNASRTERWAYVLLGLSRRFKQAEVIAKPHMGLLSATGSIVSKDVWCELGGYDERFANGGEDTELGRRMLEHGYVVVCEPILTVLHSHGLGLINSIRQLIHWYQIYKHPLPFDHDDIAKRRPDLS